VELILEKRFLSILNAIKKFLYRKEKTDEGNIEEKIIVIPDNCSPVRYIVSQAHGQTYKPLMSFSDAKQTENSVVIMEGDWGGQIYLTCPLNLVSCDEEVLKKLLDYLDGIVWACNEGEGKGIYYEVKCPGEGVSGGMGGGVVLPELWVHDEFLNIKGTIQKIIDGSNENLPEREKEHGQ
jgi:hypothetical protein